MEKYVCGCKLIVFMFIVCIFYVYFIFWFLKIILIMGDSDVELCNYGWLVI